MGRTRSSWVKLKIDYIQFFRDNGRFYSWDGGERSRYVSIRKFLRHSSSEYDSEFERIVKDCKNGIIASNEEIKRRVHADEENTGESRSSLDMKLGIWLMDQKGTGFF